MKFLFTKPWLKASSGLSVNLSAAWFAGALIGPNVSFPKTPKEFIVLLLYIVFGILFLIITVWLEREVEKYG